MNGRSRTLLRSYGTILIMWALVMLLPIVSQAQVSLNQIVTQPIDSALKPKPKPTSVPEPDTSVLLLIGIGVTGLVGYGLQRRRRAAEKTIS